MMTDLERTPQNLIKCLLFAVGDSLFAIEASKVLGIIQTDGITVIPRLEPSILGVTKLRGEICAVIDLRTRLLGKAPCGRQDSLAISIEHEGTRVCAVIDQVLSMIEFHPGDMRPVPPSIPGRGKFAANYIMRDGRYIQLLSVERLFTA